MKQLFTILCFLVFTSGFSQTTPKTIYISTSGSDTNTGELNSPYKTIQFGIDNANKGDTILVDSGTYKENINILEKNITLISKYGPDLTIIDGNKAGTCINIQIDSTGNFKLDGFSVTNGLGSSSAGGIYVSCNKGNILLTNLNVYSNLTDFQGGGISINSSDQGSITVKNCKIYSNECVNYGGGIFSSGNNLVENCVIYNNITQLDAGGLYVQGKFKMINSTIVHNLIPGGRYGAGIDINSGLDSVLLMNNVFYNNVRNSNNSQDDGVFVWNGQTFVYNNYLQDSNVVYTVDKGNIYSDSDPFSSSDSLNYNLSNFSNTIGAGADSVSFGGTIYYPPNVDINGNNRPSPSNSKPDMGAYENPLGVRYYSPTNIILSDSSVNERDSIGTTVGTLTSIDQDKSNSHTYSLVSGEGDTNNVSFTISDDTLKTNEVFYYEKDSLYTIRIQSTNGDGGSFSKSFVIKINHVNQSPTNILLSDTTVNENAPVGTVVGVLTSVDPDSSDTHTYSFVSGDGDTNNSSFSISADTLKTNEIFDYETDSLYSIRIQTDDGHGGIFSKPFTIKINNLNDLMIMDTILVQPYCSGDTTGSITYKVGEYVPPLKFLWSTGDTTQNLQNISAGNYTVTITDGAGMQLKHTFSLNPKPIFEGTQICYVSAEGQYNVVHIDKGSGNYNVGKYEIYREGNTVGDFEKIGEISADKNSFIDSTANNKVRSYGYKVSMMDKCGNESSQSEPHYTMHLSVNSGTNNQVNLIWTQYQGINVPSYYIYRSKRNEGYQLLTQISSNNTTYTDFPDSTNSLYEYYVSFEGSPCDTVLNLKSDQIIQVKSNIASTNETTGVKNFDEDNIKIYPNPVKNDRITIEGSFSGPILDIPAILCH
ncbi:MAG: cadherin domain-containing protein [Bacteroidales bacterium]|nr:cadherin domain-containing protein [Bacteroidales bacterium]